MNELVDKVKEVLSPLIIAINRHDRTNKLNYLVGGGAVLDSIIDGKVNTDFDIFLSDLTVGDYFYQILNDIGYRQYEQNTWARKFSSYNNLLDVCHLRTFSPFEYVHNVDMTVASGALDNNFIFYCRPEFFDDIQKKEINIVNVNEPDPRIDYRVKKMEQKGFTMTKKSKKIKTLFDRGAEYRNLLLPIKDEEVLTFN